MKNFIRHIFISSLLFLFIQSVFSQSDNDLNNENSYLIDSNNFISNDTTDFTPNKELSVEITKLNGDSITVDGLLDEKVWSKAKRFTNFCEVEPGDNVKPEVETEALIFYDDENFYIGFINYENDIKSIRKTFTHRDNIYSDDFDIVILDTYNEKKQAFELVVNPYGIQGDLMWTAPGNEDETFDFIFYSAAKVLQDRWTSEMVIPFKSLRFPNKEFQDWGIQIIRNRPRKNREQLSWSSISRDDPTLMTHSGKIINIKNIKGGKNLEILPYVLGSQQGEISDYGNSDSEFENGKIKGQIGGNIKYGITSNLTADLTINPDFSQVESDAAQVDVNNTYALFYPEKRPFFIEGNNVFQTPLNIFYTRTINNPLFALKLTGKIGKTDVGYTVAYDQKTPFILPFEESSEFLLTDRKSVSNILRIKHSIGNNDSYIGLILTDRQVNKDSKKVFDEDGYNRVFGFDGTLRFLKNYSFTFQTLRYFTREINFPEYENDEKFNYNKNTKALDGEYYAGFGNYLSLGRSARHWNFDLTYNDNSPVSRRDNGFISNNNFRRLSTWQGYTFFPDAKILKRIEPSVYGMLRHDYDGNIREQFLQLSLFMRFAAQINFQVNGYLINNEQFNGVFHQGARRLNINFNFNTFDWLSGGFYIGFGKSIIRNNNPYVGYVRTIEVWNTIKPIDRISFFYDWTYYELTQSYSGKILYAGFILRNTTNFQVTKNLSARIITQYDSFNKNFNFDPLVVYRINPFTIFYIGSSYNYNQIENLNDTNSKYTLTGRQYFMKLQYLWRL